MYLANLSLNFWRSLSKYRSSCDNYFACQVISIQVNIIQTEQIVFVYLGVCVYVCVTTVKEKESWGHDVRENKGMHRGTRREERERGK